MSLKTVPVGPTPGAADRSASPALPRCAPSVTLVKLAGLCFNIYGSHFVKLVLCCFVLGAGFGLGQPREDPVASLAVYTQFQQDPSSAVLASLQEELKSIMSPVGFDFEWRSLAAPRHGEAFRDLAVVKFLGRCELTNLGAPQRDPGRLGLTHITDGEILPFSEVDCNGIRGFLAPALFRLDPNQREGAYGRAIARVLAHELYHVFSRTAHHGSSGVAQPSHSVRELLAVEFNFQETDARFLAALLNTGGSPEKTARVGRSLYSGSGCPACHGRTGEGTRTAPPLRAAGKPWEAAAVAARLAGKASNMYQQARGLKMIWPSLRETDVQSLVTFLNSGLD
jgi:mono/diheme cytochrome c family protein